MAKNNSNVQPLAERTMKFAVRVIRLVESLPKKRRASEVIGRQLLRSATSVGANYRAAKRGRSTAEFIANWVYAKRKRTKPCIGLSSCARPSW